MSLSLVELGWTSALERFVGEVPEGMEIGRVVAIHRGTVVLGDRSTTVAGSLERRAERVGPAELPVVGDWVVAEIDGPVVRVLERASSLARASERGEETLVANVDEVLVVSSLDHDLNLRRLERFVAMAGEVPARLVLTKADLVEEPEVEAARVGSAVGVDALAVSVVDGRGIDRLGDSLRPGRLSVLVGMSGVGKSTIVNRLLGEERQRTLPVRARDDRGRHTTTHREIFRLPSGALLLDTPGMRLPRIADGDGLADAFSDVTALAATCRFRDCAHRGEPGCMVRAAIEAGELDPARLDALHRLEAEAEHAAARHDPAAAAARRARHRAIDRRARG